MRLTIPEWVALLAERSGLTKAQVRSLLQAQAEVAYEQARAGNTAPVPGIGVLSVTDRPAREMVLQFGPDKGKVVKVASSSKVKFTVHRMAVRTIADPAAPMPNTFHLKAWTADDDEPDVDPAPFSDGPEGRASTAD